MSRKDLVRQEEKPILSGASIEELVVATDMEPEGSAVGHPQAPRATPEDSTIGSWNSTPSCESGECQYPGAHGDAMVSALLAQPTLLRTAICEVHAEEVETDASSNSMPMSQMLPTLTATQHQWCSLDSSADESSPRHRPHRTGHATRLGERNAGCHEGMSSDSMASLSQATRSHQISTSTDSPLTHEVSAELGSDSSQAASSAALPPRFGSDPLAVGWTDFSPVHKVLKPYILSLSNPGELNASNLSALGLHGISPTSPTYEKTHAKFSHTGSHALDLFVSPEEPSPSLEVWPVGMPVQYMLPQVEPLTPGTAAQDSPDAPEHDPYETIGTGLSLSQSSTSSTSTEPNVHALASSPSRKSSSAQCVSPAPPRSILSNTTPKRSLKSVHITLPRTTPEASCQAIAEEPVLPLKELKECSEFSCRDPDPDGKNLPVKPKESPRDKKASSIGDTKFASKHLGEKKIFLLKKQTVGTDPLLNKQIYTSSYQVLQKQEQGLLSSTASDRGGMAPAGMRQSAVPIPTGKQERMVSPPHPIR